MYSIIGIYRGGMHEELDTAETKKEAYELMQEYRMAYGCEWSINIKINK